MAIIKIEMNEKQISKIVGKVVIDSIKDNVSFTKDLGNSISEKNKDPSVDVKINTRNLYYHANHPEMIVDFIIKKYVDEFERKLKMLAEHYKGVAEVQDE